MPMNRSRDYFYFSPFVSLILVIIPVSSWVLGVATRFSEGHWICALFRLFVGWNVIWVLDLVSFIFTGHIFKFF